MRIRHILIFIVYLLSVFYGFSQKFKYVTYMNDDLPFKQVNQVIQDHKYYMWLATDQGLFRFDGTTFEDYNTNLESRYIHSLIQLNDQSVLFSNDTGVYQLSYDNESVEIEPYLEVDEAISDLEYPRNLLMDSQKRLWIAQLNGGIFYYDKENAYFNRFQLVEQTKTQKIVIMEDNLEGIWALIPGSGLFYYNGKTKEFQKKPGYESYEHMTIFEDQILLAGDQVLRIQVGGNGQVFKREQLWSGGPGFTNVAVDQTGLIFLASEQGLFTLGGRQSDQLRTIYGSNDPHRVEELPFKQVNQFYFSSDQVRIGGKIWLSTPSGLGLLYSGFFKSVTGMAMDNTLALGRNFRNEILVSQGNLFRIRHKDREDSFDEFETDDISITAITNAKNNYVWLGTSEGVAIKARNVIVDQYDFSDRGGGIFYMYEDSAGDIWFCQAPTNKPIVGVAKLTSDGQFEEYSSDKGLSSRVLVVDEGGKSELYAAGIGIENYLYKLNRESNRFENMSLPFSFKVSRNFEVHDIAVDSRGIVWMATTDGLLKYDTERVQRVRLGEHTQNEIRSVVSMPDGTIWLATSTSGMIHLDTSGNFVLFDESSGTPSKIATYRALLLDDANRIWAGTAEGVVYSALSFPAPLSTKRPLLEKIQVNAQDVGSKSHLQVRTEDVVDFYFTSISFPGDKNEFRYRYYYSILPEDEIDDVPWILSEESTRVRLRAPAAGSYILEVCTHKPGGYSWSLPVEIQFNVKGPWYLSLGGISLIILAVTLLLIYGIRFYGQRKTAKLQSLLSSTEKELTAKKALLDSREDDLKNQKDALRSAGVNIYLLHRLMRQIPKRSSWRKVIPVLAKLVELPTGIDAFELAFLDKDTVQYLGYWRGSDKILQREVEFNEKENLTSYVLNHKRTLLIKNNEKEAGQYISQKDDRGFLSRIYVPFEQNKGGEVVLCIYGKEENSFTSRDLTILQILATFLSVNVTDQLK